MKTLIEYPLENGGSILVEVDNTEVEGVEHVARPGEILAKATQTFESALETIKPAASSILAKLGNLSVPVDQVSVEFGIKFGAKAGTFIASADSEANFKVNLTWKRKDQKE
jgi:hypothetical protein